MLKISKYNLKNLAMILLIYPIIVVSFKLFLIPLESYTTSLLIALVLFSYNIKFEDKYFKLLLPLSLYIYIRCIFMMQIIGQYIFQNGYGYYLKNLMWTENIALSVSDKVVILDGEIRKTILYVVCIILVLLLHIILRSNFIKRHFNILTLLVVVYFIFAWFSYVDVRMQLILYIFGVLIYKASYKKLRHVFSILTIVIILLNILNTLIPYEYINGKLSILAPEILILRSDYNNRESFFNFESTMYYPLDSLLGGSVERDSNRVIMSVITAEDILYLRGRVKDTYSGLNWEVKDNVYEKFESSKRYNEKKFTTYNLKSAFIVYENLSSLSVFSPIGALEYSLDESKLRVDSDSSVYYKNDLFEENISEYRVVFTDKDLFISDRESYMKLPDTITDRTQELAKDITENITNDRDKILAIKKYLISNYPYSLEVSNTRNYSDFVDHFLFEERQGYCTYYASALAILSRINGVPSRYVEGYIVSPQSFDGEKYIIEEDMAHAWTEVYIEDKGWIVVDSTPIYDFDEKEIETIRLEKKKASIESEKVELTTNNRIGEEVINLEAKAWYEDIRVYTIFIFVIAGSFIYINSKKVDSTNKEKALNLIYKIDKILTIKIETEHSKTQTVYYKMNLYSSKFEGLRKNQGEISGQNNAIIKDVEEILYNHKTVYDYDLINLVKYLKVIKKSGFL